MDPALERLVLDPTCRSPGVRRVRRSRRLAQLAASTIPGRAAAWCAPDHASFKKLINQYGFAFAPTAMHSARTTGYGGFHLSLEADYTKIIRAAPLLEAAGTQGAVDPHEQRRPSATPARRSRCFSSTR